MARYEHLPIHKSALDLTVHMERMVAGFSRYQKYTLGTELRERSRAVLMQVLRANNAATPAGRSTELLALCEQIDALLLTPALARVCCTDARARAGRQRPDDTIPRP